MLHVSKSKGVGLRMRILRALLVACLLTIPAGCASRQKTPSMSDRLHGTWYESRTGSAYDFATGSLLLIPHAQPTGGNAVNYTILPGDRLDVLSGPATHKVSDIATVSATTLVLADPMTGFRQTFVRDPGKTLFAKQIEAGAKAAVSQIATIMVSPQVVWVSPQPTGKGAEWTTWSTSTISNYAHVWDWASVRRDATPAGGSGTGESAVYTFSFTRKLPSDASLKKYAADNDFDATPGLTHIDVGYSASMATYPSGTFVYLPKGMVLSLGDGYVIGVALDRKNENFVPATHD